MAGLSLDKIKQPISEELEIFEKKFRESMRSKTPLLDAITRYIVKSKGKQIRPMFVFLSAKLLGDINESTYRGAALVELLHTATLVHDDVVDEATERRGFFSINAIWKNKIAVLVGDYLLSKGLLLSIENKDYELLQILSKAVKEMSEGELLQIEKTRRLDIKEEIYFEIVRQKTAVLIASACACGAYSTGASDQHVEAMRLFGEKIGIAFQIKDDLLDFGNSNTGKNKGMDIQEKKLTLPVIYSLNNCPSTKRRQIIRTIKSGNKSKGAFEEVKSFINEFNGVAYATQKMNEFVEEAKFQLNMFPDSNAKKALIDLVNFTLHREN